MCIGYPQPFARYLWIVTLLALSSLKTTMSNNKPNNHITYVLAYFAFIALASLFGELPIWVLAAALVMSLITYIAYYNDKQQAKTGGWRTDEGTLHTLGIFGGWPGALMAQKQFRHKSSKPTFQRAFKGTVALNIMALLWFTSNAGGF